MSNLAAETMTRQEAARETGLSGDLISRACHYLYNRNSTAFDRDLAEAAPTFYAAMLAHPSLTPKHRFAVVIQAWRKADAEERTCFIARVADARKARLLRRAMAKHVTSRQEPGLKQGRRSLVSYPG
ncbi:hypothetical protein MHZ93_06155 [Roseomonas sp. ACRSG]|nr:hypothetical protein [Roseomonas sp. ACRSG]